MHQIRIATQADATAIWQAEVETAAIPGHLVSRPGELTLKSFELKIRDLTSCGRFVVAEGGEMLRGHVLLTPRETSLSKPSVANVSQIVALDRGILQRRVGKIPRARLAAILSGIDVVLGRVPG